MRGEVKAQTNYDYFAELAHPQTGQKLGTQLARQDVVRTYPSLLISTEALVQQWQATHLAANVTLWATAA